MISIDKNYRTRDGRRVRLHRADDSRTAWAVTGTVWHKNGRGTWTTLRWTKDGRHRGRDDSPLDLIEINDTTAACGRNTVGKYGGER